MAKIRTLVKIEQGVPVPTFRYRYRSTRIDQNPSGTGTTLFGTGTGPQECPEIVFFFPFSIFCYPKPTLYFIHTSKPFPIPLVTSFLFNLSFNTYLTSKIFHEYLPNNSNMGHNPYTIQIQRFVRVCSKP